MNPRDPVQELIRRAMEAPRFPPNSRYAAVGLAALVGPDGQPIAYLRRRVVPPPERMTVLREHVVQQGDRLDLLAAKYLGDPEQFWKLCDANRAVDPEELIIVGQALLLTLPEGVG